MPEVDLRSDTVTRPTPGMYDAMMSAQLGDDVLGDDPTVIRLQQEVARLLGKQRALFVPSGTMANLLAVRSQCDHGDEIIIHEGGHIVNYETGAFAGIAGCSSRTIPSPDGTFDASDVTTRVRPVESHFARTRLLAVENTANAGGGTVWDQHKVLRVCQAARAHGLLCHLDGARLWNASVAGGTPLEELARPFDTVSVCFSKGLGAPVGSALVGSQDTIGRAHRLRKMLGGSMRQAGVLAGAALYALEHNIQRLADDHRNAKRLAEAIAQIPALTIDLDRVQTNILYFDVTSQDASGFVKSLHSRGVLMLAAGPSTVRAVTHLGVDETQIDRAIEAIRQAAA